MHSIATKIAGLLLAPVLALSIAGSAGAATTSAGQALANGPMIPATECTTLTHALYYGSRDALTGGDVTRLQNFLFAEGDMQVSATGYFGSITFRAVEQFQSSQGISAIGIVGPLTRAAIERVSCGTIPPPVSSVSMYSISPSSGPVGTTVTITGYGFTNDNTILFGGGAIMNVPITSSIAIACTTSPNCHGGINQTLTFTVPSALNPLCYYSGCLEASRETTPGVYDVSVENNNGTSNAMTFTVTSGTTQTDPAISSISPTSGSVGTSVTLYGSGFNLNDVVLIGGGAVANASVTNGGTQLTFTVPGSVGPYCPPGTACPMYLRLLTPGTYNVSLQDESAGSTSNVVSFTVTDSGSNQAPTISGVNAPTSLTVGAVGTWTVDVSVPSGSTTNLQYSVVWGDENVSNGAPTAQAPENVESSATFTHAYQTAGTYTPTFTVTNDSGQSATVSSTITVTPLY